MPSTMSTRPRGMSLGGSKDFDPDDLLAIFDTTNDTKPPVAPKDDANKGHAHRKSHSLVGFDPFLMTEESKEGGSGVWGQEDQDEHPLMSTSRNGGKPPVSRRAHCASKSLCVSELKNIASELAYDMPTKEEELRITLGKSTDDSIAKPERKLLRKKAHRKGASLMDISDILGSAHRRNAAKNTPNNSRPGSPDFQGIKATISPPITPPRGVTPNVSRPNTPQQSPIPTLAKQMPTSFLRNATTLAPRTSEQDPAPHQVDIPSSQDLHVHSKLCALLESYRELGDANFDFNVINNVPSFKLQAFVSLENQTIPGLVPEQKPIIQAFRECGSDVQVKGFFTHGQDNERSEVGVFSSNSNSRFIVVYRGTTEQQLKPVRAKCAPVILDNETPASVYPPFRDAYFDLETQVYGLLDKLVDENPFCDVVFTGHSFRGSLATIGAVRFAIARPMVRFSCHTFGSPKVGTHDFRQMVNTLPNLKVMRVEYGSDPNTNTPADSGSIKWEHVGHTLAVGTNSKVTAYRFDHKKPTTGFLIIRKQDNDVEAYVRAMEPFALEKLPWVALYAGEDVGKGVRGEYDEKRLMV